MDMNLKASLKVRCFGWVVILRTKQKKKERSSIILDEINQSNEVSFNGKENEEQVGYG